MLLDSGKLDRCKQQWNSLWSSRWFSQAESSVSGTSPTTDNLHVSACSNSASTSWLHTERTTTTIKAAEPWVHYCRGSIIFWTFPKSLTTIIIFQESILHQTRGWSRGYRQLKSARLDAVNSWCIISSQRCHVFIIKLNPSTVQSQQPLTLKPPMQTELNIWRISVHST